MKKVERSGRRRLVNPVGGVEVLCSTVCYVNRGWLQGYGGIGFRRDTFVGGHFGGGEVEVWTWWTRGFGIVSILAAGLQIRRLD